MGGFQVATLVTEFQCASPLRLRWLKEMAVAQFLRKLTKAVPYAVHIVLTDNGIQFTNRTRDIYDLGHVFDRICDENGIEHRLTKVKHPWTNR